jgi:uncharacterized membrane protein
MNKITKEIILIFMTGIIMIIMDSIYLSSMSDYFKNQVKLVQKTPLKLNIIGAIICYIFLVLGLYYFIISRNESILNAFLFGLVIYAVYEYTNYALLENWLFKTTVLDTAWGGILFAITTFLVYQIKKYL